MGDDRSKIAEPMHRLDVDAEVWCLVPKGVDGGCHVAGREQCTWPVVNDYPVRRGEFVSVERGIGICDDRPTVRVGGRIAGEVPGIEFLEGGVDVVGLEQHMRDDPLVGVDFDDVEYLAIESLGPSIGARPSGTTDDQAFSPGSDYI